MAKDPFDAMPAPNIVSCQSEAQSPGAYGLGMYKIMRETTLDDPSCADHSKIDKARAVFDALACLDMVSWNTMLACYAPDVHHCKDFFEKMPGPNLVSYNTLLSSLVSCRLSGEAVKIFVEMPEINAVTSTVMMQAYAREGQLASARDIYETMPDRNSVALITAQSLRTAFERFEKKQEAWSSIIAAYVQNGRTLGSLPGSSIMVDAMGRVSWSNPSTAGLVDDSSGWKIHRNE
ncbi:pentatricopeptide repeat-containing protein At4g02750-like [Selaginella moellendorffii]|uniref:pentatricopeptide repeat-containing protein At4g02750-like n=1 Tax=Selaginella moellendorffii TaxID=88036 RepID=UPI000D1D1130|nr:pentatricopeptide repeat-containing protein At4g02750-like [Selaginella moellendorffii]|eukprot:XP_024523792.1 pentatricopeptide repeat-containing protein At4g02750-like [Selaginella moellendorffii]